MRKTIFVLLLFVAFLLSGCSLEKEQNKILHIAMPYSDSIQNVTTNYYKQWLEQETGYQLEISFITENYTEEYLRLLFETENSDIDLVFFNTNSEVALQENIEQYGDKGLILRLNKLIDQGENYINRLFEEFKEYDIRQFISTKDGALYYMPSIHMSEVSKNSQILWLNQNWLKTLNLSIPQTTEDFYSVLYAFKHRDPNQNGKADELPLVGSGSNDSKQVINYIINAFIYNDPANARMGVKDGKVFFAPIMQEWREAILYLNKLYKDGLLSALNFNYTDWQLTQIASDPHDIVGGFMAHSITDVFTSSTQELIASFLHIPPLTSPYGGGYAVVNTPLPVAGGIILSSSKNQEAAFHFMDFMLSQEASLIGYYGEENIDWILGQNGDLDVLGQNAKIHIKNTLSAQQNKTFKGIGPSYLPSKYIDGVTWSGFSSDQKYMDARAAISYFPFMLDEYLKVLDFGSKSSKELQELRQGIEDYTDKSLVSFITGELDPNNDTVWEEYLLYFEELSLEKFIDEVQKSYEAVSK